MDFISSHLSDPGLLFDEEMLLAVIFLVYILHKVKKLYQANPLEEVNLNVLALSEEEKSADLFAGCGWSKWYSSTRNSP